MSSCWANGTLSSSSRTSAPVVFSTLRRSDCAQTAANGPVLAPITATGLPRRELLGNGRDAQSSAFFNAPGIDPLYSGVAIRIASASAIARRNDATAEGGCSVSASSS